MSTPSENIIKEEREILREQRQVLEEEKKLLGEERQLAKGMRRNASAMLIASAAIIAASAIGFAYARNASARVSTDKAQVVAAAVALAPQNAGVLTDVYVHEGDEVGENAVVARVGNELVKAKSSGIVIDVKQDIGKLFNRGEAVATMIDPRDLRVIARVEEDKGLKDVRPGQLAAFTVDAFPGKRYVGTVDEVGASSRDASVLFSISDKRELKEFNVKIRFDVGAYRELKNGMSAKATVFKE